MQNFWDFSVWGGVNLIAVLLFSLLVANGLKRSVKFLRASLIPTSVLAGVALLIIATAYKAITGNIMFDAAFFGGKGMSQMEILTYHALALGFIATALKSSSKKLTKQRSVEVFNTGVTTVATYLLQAVLGFGITIIVSLILKDFFAAAGILLPFGFGQGTGQALNYGTIYETEHGFVGGATFGLTVAALGFLSASLGGVIHLSILRKKYNLSGLGKEDNEKISGEQVQSDKDIPMNGGIDKLTVQIGFIFLAYLLTYLAMMGLSKLLPSMKSVVYGFNFLLGVLMASLVKTVLNVCYKKKIIKKKYLNNFMLDRISNFFFDIMVVAGIAAIRLDYLKDYWGILLILAVVGLVATYFYNLLIAKTLFKEYSQEQFLAMYGMLTGTASTGIVLLREIDPEFKTPVSDNLVYQNFPAIIFGFPLMLLATLAPKQPYLALILLAAFFVVMNVILFRSFIFKKKKVVKEKENE